MRDSILTVSAAAGMLARARGSLLGQLIGDALGSQVEFQNDRQIAAAYPDGVRELRAGGTWQTLAGQPTDDSEMALLLARSLVENGRYDAEDVFERYKFWFDSGPFDIGGTIGSSLLGVKNPGSQANGAMMRISPVGIFGANFEGHEVAEMARLDAALTHVNPVCLDANALYARAIATAVRRQTTPQELYGEIRRWAQEMNCDEVLKVWIASAASAPPESYTTNQGWVKIAFWNALYRLLHSSNFEEGVVETVMVRWRYGHECSHNRCAAWCSLWPRKHPGPVGGVCLELSPQGWPTRRETPASRGFLACGRVGACGRTALRAGR